MYFEYWCFLELVPAYGVGIPWFPTSCVAHDLFMLKWWTQVDQHDTARWQVEAKLHLSINNRLAVYNNSKGPAEDCIHGNIAQTYSESDGDTS